MPARSTCWDWACSVSQVAKVLRFAKYQLPTPYTLLEPIQFFPGWRWNKAPLAGMADPIGTPALGYADPITPPSLLVSRSARTLRWRLSAPSQRVRLPTTAGIGPTVTATAAIGTTAIRRQRARRCDRRETFSALEVTAFAWLTISTRFGGHHADDGRTQGDRLAMGNNMVPASKAVAACSSDVDDHCELVVTSFKSSRRTAARPSILSKGASSP